MKTFAAIAAITAFVMLSAPAATQSLHSIKVVDGLGLPTDMRMAPGDTERMFVCSSKRGIYIVKDGQILPDYFLYLEPIVNDLNGEGLLSMAFHPDYEVNGKFYVVYLDTNLDNRVVEYTVSADPEIADVNSATTVFGPFPQPSSFHNWDCLAFGPDGMLYLTTGDGGPPDDLDQNRAQDLGSPLGKILRLDIDAGPPYIPADNPFVGVPGALEEIWALGLRQPWRLTFDRVSGDMFLGDVGQNTREEVNFVAAGSAGGLNFGWRCMEGSLCTMFSGCQPMCDDPGWSAPIHDYPHSATEHAVIGGFVYRGGAMPWLQGAYVFGDNRSGSLWTLRYDGVSVTEFQDRTAEIDPGTSNRITTFAEGHDGELYFMNMEGELYKIVEASACGTSQYCTATLNSSNSAARIDSNGLTSITTNDFELEVVGAVPDSFGVFYYGMLQISPPFGDGIRCVGGNVFRLYPPLALDGFGAGSRAVDFTDPPEPAGVIEAGSQWNFQFWYRDPESKTADFNLSDALNAVFCP